MKIAGLVGGRVMVVCGLTAASYPLPSLARARVYCGYRPGPNRVIPPHRQGGGGTKAPALACVVTLGEVVVHVVVSVAGGFVVKCCLVSALLLERCRLRCRSISVNLGTAPSRTTALSLSSLQLVRDLGQDLRLHSYRTFQRILVLDEKLVDTVGDMLVDLIHPSLHVVVRLLFVTSQTMAMSCSLLFWLSMCAGILNCIQFLSQTSCASSSKLLSKAILILQQFVKKSVVFRT